MVPTISSQELYEKLEKGEVVLIDVREPSEHETASIPGSHLIPIGSLTLDELISFDKPLVFHCKSGRRSELACIQVLEANPSLKVYLLEGGLTAWKEAGFPLETP